MFTMKIVDSDAFLDMPLSTQALYFHLNMRADDDGFINNPKKIVRMIGAAEDDLKLLITKRFVLCFDIGVIVIKHWRMHNMLRKDRYNETQYIKQKALLIVREDGAYTENHSGNQLATTWQPSGNQLATQDREGEEREVKNSIVQYSIGEEREGEHTTPTSTEEIIKLFNSLCPSLPLVTRISQERIDDVNTLLQKYTIDQIKQGFEIAENSAFLKGDNGRNWKANFGWLVQETNMAKVLEGNYTDSPKQTGSFQTDEFVELALARTMAESQKTPPRTAGEDEEIRERAERLRERLG